MTSSHYSLEATKDFVKEGELASFIVTRSGETNSTGSVSFSTWDGTAIAENGDYEASFEELIFEAGQKQATVEVEIELDEEKEENEYFIATLAPVNDNDTVSADITQVIEDVPALDPAASIYSISRLGGSSIKEGSKAKFRIQRTGNIVFPGSVRIYTTNGSAKAATDFRGQSRILTFNAGQTSKDVKISIRRDNVSEENEYFYVNIKKPAILMLLKEG